MLAGEVRIGGGTSGGLSSCVVGWLACTEVLVMPEEIKASITPISCKKKPILQVYQKLSNHTQG